jgi:hypothetical protein
MIMLNGFLWKIVGIVDVDQVKTLVDRDKRNVYFENFDTVNEKETWEDVGRPLQDAPIAPVEPTL